MAGLHFVPPASRVPGTRIATTVWLVEVGVLLARVAGPAKTGGSCSLSANAFTDSIKTGTKLPL